jgi:hypothetical protein
MQRAKAKKGQPHSRARPILIAQLSLAGPVSEAACRPILEKIGQGGIRTVQYSTVL